MFILDKEPYLSYFFKQTDIYYIENRSKKNESRNNDEQDLSLLQVV